jgi:hypothetical protein
MHWNKSESSYSLLPCGLNIRKFRHVERNTALTPENAITQFMHPQSKPLDQSSWSVSLNCIECTLWRLPRATSMVRYKCEWAEWAFDQDV